MKLKFTDNLQDCPNVKSVGEDAIAKDLKEEEYKV